MLNVYLIRHGQTEWNADGNRYCGRTDIPLTAKGVMQAEAVGQQLANISLAAIYSSPLERAYRTAKIAGGDKTVICDRRLIEADFGAWEGKTREAFIREDPGLWKKWTEDPVDAKAGGTGETAGEIIRRVEDFFQEAFRRHDGKNIMVVGHNGINRIYLAWKLGMNVKDYRRIVQENSSVTLFSLDEAGELMLKLLNSRGIIDGPGEDLAGAS